MKKITTQEQVTALAAGSSITRYPAYSNMQQVFDATQTKNIATFEVKNINKVTGMIGLLATDTKSNYLSGSPVSVGRLSIKAAELTDGYWWL